MPPEIRVRGAPLFRVYLGLLLLLGLTALMARLPVGRWALPIALVIASGKIALIYFFFMRLKNSRWLVWVFAGAGFFWLGIAVVLTFADYFTRG